jgi:hypothetical protein
VRKNIALKAKPKAVAVKRISLLPLPVERAAYTLKEFCQAHRISRAFYYELKEQGKGPVESRLSPRGKIIISVESAARWREQRADG